MKNSLLYIVGCSRKDLPEMPIRFDAIEYTVSSKIKKKSGRRIKKEISKKEREATPVEFAKWLIKVAEKCKVRNIWENYYQTDQSDVTKDSVQNASGL